MAAFLEGRKAARVGGGVQGVRLLGEMERRRKGCGWTDAAQDERELTQEVHVRYTDGEIPEHLENIQPTPQSEERIFQDSPLC